MPSFSLSTTEEKADFLMFGFAMSFFKAGILSGAKPVTVSQGYSTIAWIPEKEGSWALPLLHERLTSFDSPITKAAAQLRLVCQNLSTCPLSLWDAEYSCASFIKQTADIAADKLMRLRTNRVFYGASLRYAGVIKLNCCNHGDAYGWLRLRIC